MRLPDGIDGLEAGATSMSMYAVHLICSSGSALSLPSAAASRAVPSSLERLVDGLVVESDVLLTDRLSAPRTIEELDEFIFIGEGVERVVGDDGFKFSL